MGWRDCQSNREVSVADRERLEAELNRLVHNNGAQYVAVVVGTKTQVRMLISVPLLPPHMLH